MRFLLYDVGNPNALEDVDPARGHGCFPFCSVSRRDARSYSCGYCTKSDPPVWSEPSDPEELVVPGAAAPLDFTNANIARLVLGTVVLLILGLSWI
ncbi:unnamed protein product [Caretta caretta]